MMKKLILYPCCAFSRVFVLFAGTFSLEAAIPSPLLIPRLSKAPVLDGKLNDKVWENSKEYKFTNTLQKKVAPPSFVRFGYDRENLYIAIRYLEPDMANRRVTRHDPTSEDAQRDDNVDILISPAGANVYQLIACSNNSRFEIVGKKTAWRSNAKMAFFTGKDFWSAEIAIPFASFGWTPGGGEIWQLAVSRQRVVGNTKSWSTLANLSPRNFLTNMFPVKFGGSGRELTVKCGRNSVDATVFPAKNGRLAVTAFGPARERMKKIVKLDDLAGNAVQAKIEFPFVIRSMELEHKSSGRSIISKINIHREKEKTGPRVMTVKNPLFKELPRDTDKKIFPGILHWYACFHAARNEYDQLKNFYMTPLQFGFEYVQKKRFEYAAKHDIALIVSFARDPRMIARYYKGKRVTQPFWKWFTDRKIMYRGWAIQFAESEKKILANVEKMVKNADKDNLQYVFFGDELVYWSAIACIELYKDRKDSYPFVRKMNEEIKSRFGGGKWGIPKSMEDPTPGRWIAFGRYHSGKMAELHRKEYEIIKRINPRVGLITEDAHLNASRQMDYALMRGKFDIATLQPAMHWGELDNLATMGFDIKKQKDLSDAKEIRPCIHFENWLNNFTLDEVIDLFSQAVQAGATGWHIYDSDTKGVRSGRNYMICDHFGAPDRAETVMNIAHATPQLRYPDPDCAFFASQDSAFTIYKWHGGTRFMDCEIPAYTILGPKAGIWFRFENVTSAALTGLKKYKAVFVVDAPYEREESLTLLNKYVNDGGTLILFDPNAFKNDALAAPRKGLEKLYGAVPLKQGKAKKALVWKRQKYTFPTAPWSVKVLPGTRVIAKFTDGTPAVMSRKQGKGKVIYFAVNPFEKNRSDYNAAVKFMQQFFAGHGIKINRDIWRFRFPDTVKAKIPDPAGKCLTGNHIVWSRFIPKYHCNDAVNGTYSWSRKPDKVADVSNGKIPFTRGKITNRHKAVDAGNVMYGIGKLDDYVVSFSTSKPMTLSVDLGKVCDVDRMELLVMHSLPAIRISGSADGKQWKSFDFAPHASENFDVHNKVYAIPGQFRYIKVDFSAVKKAKYAPVISEMEIWRK